MHDFIDEMLNFNNGKKIHFEKGLFWGLVVFFSVLVSLELFIK